MTENRLGHSVQYVKGVGPARARTLARLGVDSVGDLLEHFPRYHDDRTSLRAISDLVPGTRQTFRGRVLAVNELRPRPRMHLVKVLVGDGSGTVAALFWNQPYRQQTFKVGTPVVMSGRVEFRFGELQVDAPEFEFPGQSENLHSGRWVPVYPLVAGLTQVFMRRIVANALELLGPELPDALPAATRERLGLVDAVTARRHMHFPPGPTELERARRRLAFEELYVLQVALGLVRRMLGEERPGIAHAGSGALPARVRASLPFRLTAAQERALGEVWADMSAPRPMNRLIQGDVGSGKTVVAALAMAAAVDAGYQAALMAPTELLAEQHYASLGRYLGAAGVKIGLLTGSTTRRRRDELGAGLRTGAIQVLVGTHAVIEEHVEFQQLSLAVTDEQHRFGVRQRARLTEKGTLPDVLVMTATPIPRTLALTVYGDLDISTIDQLPPGRRPVRTYWRQEDRRPLVYAFVRREVSAGRQAYVVCPLVAESEVLECEAATELAQTLASGVLRGVRVGLLHGRLPARDKHATMQAFRASDIQVLVCTTVIEVGVDVPNATVMVIEGAERFGLSQLHQLRGRVGRGHEQSHCILIGNPRTAEARQRLEALTRHHDGFRLAEEDLRLRGPGEFLGTRQHGIPDFKVADIARDLELVEEARREAARVLAADPGLTAPQHRQLQQAVVRRYGSSFGLLSTG